jgi:hypothetical protein
MSIVDGRVLEVCSGANGRFGRWRTGRTIRHRATMIRVAPIVDAVLALSGS